MSFITEGTGSFFEGPAKVDYRPSSLAAQFKLPADEVNQVHDALLNLRDQFASGSEIPLEVRASGSGIIIKSPDGQRWIITVSNGGTLSTTTV